jgi:hypothetical protein
MVVMKREEKDGILWGSWLAAAARHARLERHGGIGYNPPPIVCLCR